MRQLEENIDHEAAVDGVADDEEISEQDDANSERDRLNSTRSNMDEDAQDSIRNEEAAQEGESDNEFFHEAETESDSDDNHSAQDAQRSAQTGATAGSDTGEVHHNNFMFASQSAFLLIIFLFSDFLGFMPSLYLFLTYN